MRFVSYQHLRSYLGLLERVGDSVPALVGAEYDVQGLPVLAPSIHRAISAGSVVTLPLISPALTLDVSSVGSSETNLIPSFFGL